MFFSANVPLLYGIRYLKQHSSQIALNPTLFSAPFIYANQTSIAVSLWCRALEAARHLQRDVRHVTLGHTHTSTDGKYAGQNYYAASSFRQTPMRSRGKPPQEEDEIELHPVDSRMKYTASIRGADADAISDQPSHQDIEVTKQVWVR